MEKVTLQGPVTVLQTADFQALVRRVEALEQAVRRILGDQLLSEQVLHEATADYDVQPGVLVSENTLSATGLSAEEFLIELAVYLFDKEVLTLGQAKSLAGMPMADFMQLVGRRGLSSIHYGVQELEEDVETLKQMGLWHDRRS